MRPYKYRVWNGREMVSPDYIDREGFAHWKEDSVQCQSQKISQFIGVYDKNGAEIYVDDIISDGKFKYRVYAVPGGFAIKSPFWSSDMKELIQGDELIIQPLADAQTISFITQIAEVAGNIYANPELIPS